jgi:hypothetical protein
MWPRLAQEARQDGDITLVEQEMAVVDSLVALLA